jgi:hypothetical protein
MTIYKLSKIEPQFGMMPRALVPLCGYLYTRKGHCTGITFVTTLLRKNHGTI